MSTGVFSVRSWGHLGRPLGPSLGHVGRELQVAPGTHDVAWELSSGNTGSTKWPTVGSGHSRYGLGVVFWEHEEHKVVYNWLRALTVWPGNGVLARCIVIPDKSFTFSNVMICCALAWLGRNEHESHEVR